MPPKNRIRKNCQRLGELVVTPLTLAGSPQDKARYVWPGARNYYPYLLGG